MDNTRTIEKIAKLGGKGKSSKIIKFLSSDDGAVVKASMMALVAVGDEDAVNSVTHLIDHNDPEIRTLAAQCLGKIGTEYSKTYLQHRAAIETEQAVKEAITGALHEIATKKN